MSLFSGAFAGMISRSLTSPLERIKILQQVNVGKSSLWTTFLHVLYKEGIMAFWKGNLANCLRVGPHSAITFAVFDVSKQQFRNRNGNISSLGLLCSGAMAGMIASSLTYPLDLVNALLAAQTDSRRYTGIGHAISDIFKREGVRGLYRGIGATLLGIAPYIAINFATFDTLKQIYLPDKNSPYFSVINLGLGAIAGANAATLTFWTDTIRRRLQIASLRKAGEQECN